jgi:hypothetical protein
MPYWLANLLTIYRKTSVQTLVEANNRCGQEVADGVTITSLCSDTSAELAQRHQEAKRNAVIVVGAVAVGGYFLLRSKKR